MVLGPAGFRIPDYDQRVDSICMALKPRNSETGVLELCYCSQKLLATSG